MSFKNQITGAEGMLVTANDFTLEDLAIEDTRGDGLKINEGKNITLRRVRVEWTNGPDTGNGAYGLYPVQTENTLIEESVAIGASDAGIYVGQSRNVIVRNNYVAYNVAGIEIENTVDADVYDNIATHNTGGILVFNMPDLTLNGVRTRVFNNQITHNNTANFAKPGGPVAGVPAGSGVVINSNDQVEVFANDMQYNQTAHILISSVYSSNYSEREAAAGFDPYPEMIAIHGNRYEGGGDRPGADYLTTSKMRPSVKMAASPMSSGTGLSTSRNRSIKLCHLNCRFAFTTRRQPVSLMLMRPTTLPTPGWKQQSTSVATHPCPLWNLPECEHGSVPVDPQADRLHDVADSHRM